MPPFGTAAAALLILACGGAGALAATEQSIDDAGIESNGKWFAETTAIKCPATNAGIFEQILKDKQGYIYKYRMKYINGDGKKYILERASPGKGFEVLETFDIENPKGNLAVGTKAIADASRLAFNYCQATGSTKAMLDAVLKHNDSKYKDYQ